MKLKNITDEATRKSFGLIGTSTWCWRCPWQSRRFCPGWTCRPGAWTWGRQSLCETPHPLKSASCWSWGRASGIASSGSGYVVEIDSLERPLRLLHDCGEGLYGSKELIPLLPVLDVAGVDVEALHLTEDVLHHYLEAVEASHLWNIDLYNDNALLILRITPSSLSYIFLFFLFLRIEVDRKVPRLWADDTWHRFSSWSKRRHINSLIIIFPDICRTVSKCKSKYGSLLLICWDDLADVTL